MTDLERLRDYLDRDLAAYSRRMERNQRSAANIQLVYAARWPIAYLGALLLLAVIIALD